MYACLGASPRSPKQRPSNHIKQKPTAQSKRAAEREKRSTSSSYRNRSLKQLFGDIPAISEYLSVQSTAANPKEAPQISASPANQPCPNRQVADEYLIKRRERQKTGKRHNGQNLRSPRQEDRYKRKLLVQSQPADTTASTHRMHTDSAFYDPNAYCWRKNESKDKSTQKSQEITRDLLVSKGENIKQDATAQSEYYGSLRQSHPTNLKAVESPKIIKIRSSSIEFLKSQRCKKLKPRVVKHIFEMKSPRKKHASLSNKKNLLFTFGL